MWFLDVEDSDGEGDGGIFHVLPFGDMCRHVPNRKCWCQPEQDDEVPTLWVHNSMDQREKFETGERKVS